MEVGAPTDLAPEAELKSENLRLKGLATVLGWGLESWIVLRSVGAGVCESVRVFLLRVRVTA